MTVNCEGTGVEPYFNPYRGLVESEDCRHSSTGACLLSRWSWSKVVVH